MSLLQVSSPDRGTPFVARFQAGGAAYADRPITPVGWAIIFVALPLLYFAGAKFGMNFTLAAKGFALVWPPNGITLAVMLRLGPRSILPCCGVVMATEFAADLPYFGVRESLLFGVMNAGEATLAYLLLRALGFDPDFRRLGDILRFVLAGPIISTFLAGAFGSATIILELNPSGSFYQSARILWFGDALGQLIFTPLLLAFWPVRDGPPPPPPLVGRKRQILTGLICGAAIVVYLCCNYAKDLLPIPVPALLLLPFLLLAAAHTGARGSTVLTALVALAVIFVTTLGHDPFLDPPAEADGIQTQEFIFTAALMALGLRGLLMQLRLQEQALRESRVALEQANRVLEERVQARTAALSTVNRELERLSRQEPLTGLLNRRAFFEAGEALLARAQAERRPLCLILCDIDEFKAVNDSRGHQAGDEVLQAIARRLAVLVRGGDLLARYGGEEFILLVPDSDLERGRLLAQRLAEGLRATPFEAAGLPLRVTASFGVTALTSVDLDLDDLISRADRALYAAKASGRDGVVAIAG